MVLVEGWGCFGYDEKPEVMVGRVFIEDEEATEGDG